MSESSRSEPVAVLFGEPICELPAGLYVPPKALQLLLEVFEGPFDLLWFLIRKDRLDVRDLPIARITDQYLAYLEAFEALDLYLAAEYLLMAAVLIELKVRSLVRSEQTQEHEQEQDGVGASDPRAELAARLVRYDLVRRAAERLDALARAGRDWRWLVPVEYAAQRQVVAAPCPEALRKALQGVLQRAAQRKPERLSAEPVALERVRAELLAALMQQPGCMIAFRELIAGRERRWQVAAFGALLELMREGVLEAEQPMPGGPLWVRYGAERKNDESNQAYCGSSTFSS